MEIIPNKEDIRIFYQESVEEKYKIFLSKGFSHKESFDKAREEVKPIFYTGSFESLGFSASTIRDEVKQKYFYNQNKILSNKEGSGYFAYYGEDLKLNEFISMYKSCILSTLGISLTSFQAKQLLNITFDLMFFCLKNLGRFKFGSKYFFGKYGPKSIKMSIYIKHRPLTKRINSFLSLKVIPYTQLKKFEYFKNKTEDLLNSSDELMEEIKNRKFTKNVNVLFSGLFSSFDNMVKNPLQFEIPVKFRKKVLVKELFKEILNKGEDNNESSL